ncbi:MAG TPA: cinnamoyl-CoA:phenyllactate CoA-transferase, partial [Coriobacteriia bacterium]|nr:cinnamoyl-CoA:phenyllactate CoA-transferase [Coriobacteriia bacterium]
MEVLFKLLETADVFMCNLRTDSLKRLGLDYESLKERFPGLIYAGFSGYG